MSASVEKIENSTSEEVMCKIQIKKRIAEHTLRGKVQIVSKDVLVIQQAYIEIVGLASCNWQLDKIYIRCPKFYRPRTTVKGLEQFYYTRHSLCGGELSHNHKGYEFYKFKCYWPSRLPGTWIGDFGKIEYIAKVTIKLEDNTDIFTHSQAIFVQFRRHLSTEKHLLFEERVDVNRNFFTTKSIGNVIVSVWIPISGIGAGQSVPVLCSVINYSKLHFGSIIFVLTRIDFYRSDNPLTLVKQVRTDICRIARMVDIHKGRYDYFAVIKTDPNTIPTNQFYRCSTIQTIYEIWVSVQGAFKRYRSFGYPNIDTPGIPLVIGTTSLKNFNCFEIATEIFKKMNTYDAPLLFDELPEDFKKIIHTTEEELSKEAVENLERQLQVNEQLNTALRVSSSQKFY